MLILVLWLITGQGSIETVVIKNIMSNFLKSILIIALLISIPKITFGADLFIKTTKEEYKIGEQFIVSVEVVSTSDAPINALDFNIGFSNETLKFVNSIERNSIVSFFVDRPRVQNNIVYFSGITPGGFYGVIDPIIDPAKIQPVKVIDLIFEPISPGRAEIYLDKGEMFRNDGSGLAVDFLDWPRVLNIKDEVLESKIDLMDTNPPLPFKIQIVQDKNISKNYLLIFNTKDEESGIDYYEIIEEGRKSQVSESPYILKNKPPRGVVIVKAYDKAGNIQTSYVDAPIFIEKNKNVKDIILIVAIICLLSLWVFYKNKKRKLLS